jgi:hypothetical protein
MKVSWKKTLKSFYWTTLHRKAQYNSAIFLAHSQYNKITCIKSPSFYMTTFSASLTNLTVLLPQSHECKCYWHLHCSDCRNTLTYAHTILCSLQTSDISLGLVTLPVPEAGDFVELILLHLPYTGHASNPRKWHAVPTAARIRVLIFFPPLLWFSFDSSLYIIDML